MISTTVYLLVLSNMIHLITPRVIRILETLLKQQLRHTGCSSTFIPVIRSQLAIFANSGKLDSRY